MVDQDMVAGWVIEWDAEHLAADPDCEACVANSDSPPVYLKQAAAVMAALDTALWAGLTTGSGGGNGESFFDAGYGVDDIDEDAVKGLAADVAAFWHDNAADLTGTDPGQVGHDFILTRDRHGTGFWDRGLGDVGDRLTDACRPFGDWDLYEGDNGKLYAL